MVSGVGPVSHHILQGWCSGQKQQACCLTAEVLMGPTVSFSQTVLLHKCSIGLNFVAGNFRVNPYQGYK